ncbi:hypothetical protein [Nocardioides soli]|uniref:Uncharacterized protein n=1 Tax=Nocardioides soli TaxID=1036020 RepID=A0A7W4VZS5_9ACTN|nr:hypothetical protein [Nocardioides soli]MBB3044339.1 hypothetical protein [Nocardioides soli]
MVRTSWREGVDDDLPTLDLRSRFEAQGRSRWSEADAEGTVTVHESAGDVPTEPRRRAERG